MAYYPVTPEFERALRQSHTMVARLDVVHEGEVVKDFAFLGGDVTVDYDDNVRRSLDCEVVDEDGATFDLTKGLIDPAIATYVPWRGIRYSDGTEELVPLGEFHGAQVEAGEHDGAVTWRLRAFDAAIRAQKSLEDPVFIPSGTDLHQAIPMLVRQGWPNMTFNLPSSRFTTPLLLVREDSDAWNEARELALSFGEDLTIDRDGSCISPPRVLSADTDPVWSFVEGDNATSWDPRRSLDADSPVNVVTVIGTNPGAPGVRGVAADMDPGSKTYRYGPGGERSYTERSEKVVSNEQATSMAQAILSRKLGKQDQVEVRAVPNPALDVGSIAAAYREKLGLDGDRLIVAHLGIPLVAETEMVVVLRRSILVGSEDVPLRTFP